MGHRSLEALRVYERTSAFQQEAASSILSDSHPGTYSQQIHAGRHHSTNTTLTFGATPSSSASGPVYLGNLYGCTVNINNYTQLEPPTIPSFSLSQTELEDFLSDFELNHRLILFSVYSS